jgi:hypothetical protein
MGNGGIIPQDGGRAKSLTQFRRRQSTRGLPSPIGSGWEHFLSNFGIAYSIIAS